jgi:hypothetical protein
VATISSPSPSRNTPRRGIAPNGSGGAYGSDVGASVRVSRAGGHSGSGCATGDASAPGGDGGREGAGRTGDWGSGAGAASGRSCGGHGEPSGGVIGTDPVGPNGGIAADGTDGARTGGTGVSDGAGDGTGRGGTDDATGRGGVALGAGDITGRGADGGAGTAVAAGRGGGFAAPMGGGAGIDATGGSDTVGEIRGATSRSGVTGGEVGTGRTGGEVTGRDVVGRAGAGRDVVESGDVGRGDAGDDVVGGEEAARGPLGGRPDPDSSLDIAPTVTGSFEPVNDPIGVVRYSRDTASRRTSCCSASMSDPMTRVVSVRSKRSWPFTFSTRSLRNMATSPRSRVTCSLRTFSISCRRVRSNWAWYSRRGSASVRMPTSLNTGRTGS